MSLTKNLTIFLVSAVALIAAILISVPTIALASVSSGGGSSSGGGAGSDNSGMPWTQISIAKFETGVSSGCLYTSCIYGANNWWAGVDPAVCRDPNARIYTKLTDHTYPMGQGFFGWSQTHAYGYSNLPASFRAAINGREYINVVCGYDKERRTQSLPQTQPQSTSGTITSDYSWRTSIVAQLNSAAGVDPIGLDNLENQAGTTVITPFGALYQSAASGSGTFAAKFAALQNAHNVTNRTAAHSMVELSNNNKAGLAEGGVLNVLEHTSTARVSYSEAWTMQRTLQRTCDFDYGTYNNPTNCTRPGDGYNSPAWTEKPNSRSHTVTKNTNSQANTGFWQILSVHCNPNELNQLLNSITGETVVSQTPGVNGNSTVVIHTQKRDTQTAAINAGQFLGSTNANNPNPVKRTANLGFYDKECDLTCVSFPTTSTGASTANGATTNVSITTNVGGKDYIGGAFFNGEVNSSYLEIFRDNETRKVNLNTWYPRNTDSQYKYGGTYPNAATGSGTITRPAAAPISTTITRWAQGTPTTSADGGQFIMKAVRGTSTVNLFSGSGTPAVQKNFGANTYTTLNSSTLTGLYRTFDIQATWASEQNLPQVINVKWEYQPTVWTRFPSNIGFSNLNANTHNIASHTVRDQAVDGKCYAQYGTNNRDLDLLNRVQGSTGTGTTNTLDSGLLETAAGDNSYQIQSNLVLKFLRAVSE